MAVTDTDILDWKDDFLGLDTNTPTNTQDIAGELDEEFRNIKSVIKEWSEDKNWLKLFVEENGNPSYSGTTLTGLNAAGIEIVGGDYREYFERGRILRFSSAKPKTYYMIVLETSYSSSLNTTRVSCVRRPYAVDVEWGLLDGNDLVAVAEDQSFVNTDISNANGQKNVMLWLNDKLVCTPVMPIDDPLGFGNNGGIGVHELVEQGLLTSHTDADFTWVVDINTNGKVHEIVATEVVFLLDLYVGGLQSGLTKSQLPSLYQSGSAIITGDGTTGPYALSALARAEIDASYKVLLQVRATSLAAPTNGQLVWRVTSKSTTSFSVAPISGIGAGETVTLDWLIHR